MGGREEELLARVETIMAATRRDAERVARQDGERDAARAAAARSGELGADWREVQARIDAGRTSLAEVFGGTDPTPAAVRLRAQAQASLDAVQLPAELTEEIAALRGELP